MGLRAFIILSLGGIACAFVWHYTGDDSRSPASAKGANSPEGIVEEYRVRLLAAVESNSALNFSVAKNPAQFACLYSVSGSCQNQGGAFQLYPMDDAASQPLTQLAYGTGIRRDGTGCRDFPSTNCPLRLESRWVPVCSGAVCDNVRSMRVEVSVVYSDGIVAHQAREERLVQPTIQLSESTRCAREGGYFDGRQCVRGQSAERAVASSSYEQNDRNGPERAAQEVPAPVDPRDFPLMCPDVIAVQGEEYVAELIEPGKARVRLPATNLCPDAHDTFIFSCVAISASQDPYARSDQGQWQQSQALMAPPCDENGNPIGAPVVGGG